MYLSAHWKMNKECMGTQGHVYIHTYVPIVNVHSYMNKKKCIGTYTTMYIGT